MKGLTSIIGILIFSIVIFLPKSALSNDHECAQACSEFTSDCLSANEHDMNDNPEAYAYHVNVCEAQSDGCFELCAA